MSVVRRLARLIWHGLPRAGRRRFFIALSTALAPRTRSSSARLPVIVGGVLRSATGLGESARMNVEGLRRAGLPFGAVDLSKSLLGSPDLPPLAAAGHASPVGPGSLILHVSGPFIPYALRRCGQSVVRQKHVIGYWHWELPRLPKDWAVGMAFVHEVWVPSQFCADAVRHDFNGPVRIIPHLVDVGNIGKSDRPNDVFRVVTMFNMGSGFERKNPLASVRAFQRAFGHDPAAHLLVKVLNPAVYPAGMAALTAEIEGHGNITLLTEPLARSEVCALIAGADAVMSLHRAEGFGLLAAEAMLIGVPVIATDWSATTDFVTTETAIPVPYRLIPANDPQGCYHHPDQLWADPECVEAARGLVRLREDRPFAASLARTAKTRVTSLLSADRYAQRLRAALGK